MRQHKYDYDAFISHAVEDKIPIANELCAKLERAGLRIWYSGKELGIGDSIEKTIENGLHRSRFGIVILSPTYLAKNWTIREFYTLLAKEIEERKVILPVLYNITLDDLKKKDLLMADRFAVNADRGIDYVVDRLVHEIRKPNLQRSRVAWFSRMWLVLILSLLANLAFLVKNVVPGSTPDSLPIVTAELGVQRSQGQMMSASILHEMQGLVNQLNTCTCAKDRSGIKPRFATNHSGQQHDAHRVKMAVVFQIEATPQSEETSTLGGSDAGEAIETISLAENAPFIMVSNRESYPNNGERTCVRAVDEVAE